MLIRLSKRFTKKFGNSPIYGAPHWATYLLLKKWKNLDMRHSLNN